MISMLILLEEPLFKLPKAVILGPLTATSVFLILDGSRNSDLKLDIKTYHK